MERGREREGEEKRERCGRGVSKVCTLYIGIDGQMGDGGLQRYEGVGTGPEGPRSSGTSEVVSHSCTIESEIKGGHTAGAC